VRFEVYLQGSYRNSTNIAGESDVDIVAELQSTFYYNIDRMNPSDAARWRESRPDATYSWFEFRADCHAALRAEFGSASVSEGDKCLRVAPAAARLPADVLPATTHRHYFDASRFVDGITFWTRSGRQVVNYPQQHFDNGVAKQAATTDRFKPTVRIFKNARSRAVELGLLGHEDAPSYFLQCLFYNANNAAFRAGRQETYVAVLADCQNGLIPLFGGSREQWEKEAAVKLVAALTSLWERGG
jgi:hypothetical protein